MVICIIKRVIEKIFLNITVFLNATLKYNIVPIIIKPDCCIRKVLMHNLLRFCEVAMQNKASLLITYFCTTFLFGTKLGTYFIST